MIYLENTRHPDNPAGLSEIWSRGKMLIMQGTRFSQSSFLLALFSILQISWLSGCKGELSKVDQYDCKHAKVEKVLAKEVNALPESQKSGLQVLYIHRAKELNWDSEAQKRTCKGVLKTNRKKLFKLDYTIQGAYKSEFEIQVNPR